MKSHQRSAFWCSSGFREEAEIKTCFLFVVAGFNGQWWFLSIEVSEADFYMPATGSVLAGEKQALLKQIVEAASIFFTIFSWKVRGCDVSKIFKEELAGRNLYGLLGSSAHLPLPST